MTASPNDRSGVAGNHPSHGWTNTLLPRTLLPRDLDASLPEAFHEAMTHPAYPRSNAWNPWWQFANSMGPIATWLVEDLAPAMHFQPGQRVLDLGCGGALTSIFLAREYGLEVWAADLWVDPHGNAARIAEAACERQVFPIMAEARRLPFAHGFFDAIVSIDSYHYFGTDIRYLSYLAQFVKPGGRIGIAVPGNSVDPDDPRCVAPPPALAEELGADWFTFRNAEWWRRLWSATPCVDIEQAEMIEGGRESWLRQCDAVDACGLEGDHHLGDRPFLECEAGQTIGMCKAVARRNDKPSLCFGPGEYATRIA